ncbi:hypothetical protein [Gracilibacillus sp. YIM 98692]|uniref:hypothetical protein n=1 Tax=Gracilibacillus sp. YIM 98692 TaxID=2663532 RepID=UPI0013D4BF1B|nr:hypothetical protein [Gracilibacillus sp. YIM 98692]
MVKPRAINMSTHKKEGAFIEDKIKKIFEDEMSLLTKAKKGLEDKYVTIPIAESMIRRAVSKKKIKGITNLDIRLVKDKIVISGAAKKLRITIHFQMDLKPLAAENRELSFRIVRMKPLNQEWLTKKLLNKSPYLHCHKGIIHIDLNQMEKAKAIRIGKLKHFEVRDEKLWIGVGL